ncbi:hypothetical protein CQW23_28095 [Capsicum baccatum]|uniref:Uncharacterized protein n=1 Tax=Capsicum baccatum TaxID=33114 RepID=A0A2G2VFN1_CAPBA|nr:hypothetical protein CQW23_28095 [Capsicum baccatum]
MEHTYIELALQSLLPNPNIWISGYITSKRQVVLSFLIYTITYSSSSDGNGEDNELYLWREMGNKRDKPIYGPFVAKLLNDPLVFKLEEGVLVQDLMDISCSRALLELSLDRQGSASPTTCPRKNLSSF